MLEYSVQNLIENNLKAAGPMSEGCTLQGLVYRQKPWTSPAMARPNSSESAEVMQGLCQTLQVRDHSSRTFQVT